MIDVVFLLLIFFVCASIGKERESILSTPLASGGSVESVNLKQDPGPLGEVMLTIKQKQDDKATVQVAEGGEKYLLPDDFQGLKKILLGLAVDAPEIPVIIDPGPEVTAEHLLNVSALCREAKFEHINFATRKK